MQPRAVRVTLEDVEASFASTPCALVDISRAGALLKTTERTALGAEGPLTLQRADHHAEFQARVVRVRLDQESLSSGTDVWLIALEFQAPATPEISRLLHRLLAQ